MMFGGSINRTQGPMMALNASLVSPLEKGTTKGLLCPCWSWSLPLTRADSVEAWLFLLGGTTATDSCLLS